MIQWDGDKIVGEEPGWFQNAVRDGVITRSADGMGFVLYIHTSVGILEVLPGHWLFSTETGDILSSDKPEHPLNTHKDG